VKRAARAVAGHSASTMGVNALKSRRPARVEHRATPSEQHQASKTKQASKIKQARPSELARTSPVAPPVAAAGESGDSVHARRDRPAGMKFQLSPSAVDPRIGSPQKWSVESEELVNRIRQHGSHVIWIICISCHRVRFVAAPTSDVTGDKRGKVLEKRSNLPEILCSTATILSFIILQWPHLLRICRPHSHGSMCGGNAPLECNRRRAREGR
jgi:hypothetical protein